MTDIFRDNREAGRFELAVGEHLAWADYHRHERRLIIPHVEAQAALRGTGAAGRLMEHVALTARAEGLKITPSCSYAAAWMQRHAQFADLLA